MTVAKWNGKILAQSNKTIIIEGNHYFPPKSMNDEFFENSDYQTTCHWKGQANYYHLNVENKKNKNAAWYYPNPKPEAENIKNYIAFWKGVEIFEE